MGGGRERIVHNVMMVEYTLISINGLIFVKCCCIYVDYKQLFKKALIFDKMLHWIFVQLTFKKAK